MLEEKVIQFNKVKIIVLTLAAFALVVLGSWLLSMDTSTRDSQGKIISPIPAYGVGIVLVIFFGWCCFIGVKKLFDKSPGLIISSEGILDNSTGVAAGIIPWSEVVGIGEYEHKNQKFISIQVKDPEKYVNNGNALIRMANQANLNMCGTPVNISAKSLKISYHDLLAAITDYYSNSQKNT